MRLAKGLAPANNTPLPLSSLSSSLSLSPFFSLWIPSLKSESSWAQVDVEFRSTKALKNRLEVLSNNKLEFLQFSSKFYYEYPNLKYKKIFIFFFLKIQNKF